MVNNECQKILQVIGRIRRKVSESFTVAIFRAEPFFHPFEIALETNWHDSCINFSVSAWKPLGGYSKMTRWLGTIAVLTATIVSAASLGLNISAARADVVYVGVNDGSFFGVARFTPTLGLLDQVELTTFSSPVTALAAGNPGEFYAASANRLSRFDDAGTQLGTITGSASTMLPALDYGNGTVYTAVNDGSFFGVARFTPTLGLLDQVELTTFSSPVTALAAGNPGEFYAASANRLSRFDDAGTQLTTITGSATTMLPALDFADGVVYIGVTDGTFFGIAKFTPTLGLIDQIELDDLTGPITGLAIGTGGEFYIGSENRVFRYDAVGNLIDSISGSATTMLPAVSYFAEDIVVATPEPGAVILFAFGLAAAAVTRRRKTS